MIELATQKDVSYAQTLAQIAKDARAAFWTAKQFEDELNLACAQIFLYRAQAAKEPLGFVCFRVYQDEAELTNFAVKVQEQNKHFGTELLTFALTTLLARGIKKITLEVSAQNAKAKKIYTDFGFKKVSLRKNFYEGGIDAELMLFTV